MKALDINHLENIIGYNFSHPELLHQAFTHSSLTNEDCTKPSYEKLEFLGDAIIGYVIALTLYQKYPHMDEGKLSKARATLVSWHSLSKVVDDMDIMEYLQVGKGQIQQDILHSNTVKCDLFEAILGAILVDSNYDIDTCKDFINRFLSTQIANIQHSDSLDDYKSLLLEECAKKGIKVAFIPKKQETTDFFIVDLFLDNKYVSSGKGVTKKSAEKRAAEHFYKSD